jgi:phosphoribosylaminoimidazole-succinocarboxamide synthase
VVTREPILRTELPGLTLWRRGKVRDVYDMGDPGRRLLFVATDRLSAFDCVLPTGIPDKGRVLTQISAFWFKRMEAITAHHMVSTKVPADLAAHRETLEGRTMLVEKTEPVPFECVVRGYLAGSGWEDYRRTGSVCGIRLPPGLQQAQELPEPIFTPATKAESGHDVNVPYEVMSKALGEELARILRERSIAIYRAGREYALGRGILLADTKFEWGLKDGAPLLIDECLTPDSSRFWSASEYRLGSSPPSFDKQFVRDHLLKTGWDRTPPAPPLPPDIVGKTAARYREAYQRLTGATCPKSS